jgi:hypothetical protein
LIFFKSRMTSLPWVSWIKPNGNAKQRRLHILGQRQRFDELLLQMEEQSQERLGLFQQGTHR